MALQGLGDDPAVWDGVKIGAPKPESQFSVVRKNVHTVPLSEKSSKMKFPKEPQEPKGAENPHAACRQLGLNKFSM